MKIDSSAINFLKDYFVDLSVMRMNKHCLQMNFESAEVESYENGKVMGEEISLIMLWGEIGSVVLKAHYNMDIAREIAGIALGALKETVSDEMVRAYMNEFNNLMGGFFRGILEEERVLIGMSLPFITRGSDELCFFKIRDSRYVFTKWKVKSNQSHEFYCTSEILLISGGPILKCESKLSEALAKDKKDEGGDIEFF